MSITKMTTAQRQAYAAELLSKPKLTERDRRHLDRIQRIEGKMPMVRELEDAGVQPRITNAPARPSPAPSARHDSEVFAVGQMVDYGGGEGWHGEVTGYTGDKYLDLEIYHDLIPQGYRLTRSREFCRLLR